MSVPRTSQATRPATPPVQYYGGIEGMNAANLIGALQTNGVVSGSYSANASESEITPPPAIIDRGA